MPTIASDDFNRANGDVGTNWTATQNGFNVSTNTVVGNAAAVCLSYWNANSFPSNQWAQVTIVGSGNTNAFGPAVRLQAGAVSGYVGYCFLTGSEIHKLTAGVSATLVASGPGFASNDVAQIQVNGSTLSLLKNGVVVLTATDSAFTGGSAGLFAGSNVDTHGDAWSAGDLGGTSHEFLRYQRENR